LLQRGPSDGDPGLQVATDSKGEMLLNFIKSKGAITPPASGGIATPAWTNTTTTTNAETPPARNMAGEALLKQMLFNKGGGGGGGIVTAASPAGTYASATANGAAM